MRVLLLGSTGLTGRHCLAELLARTDVSEIRLPVRRLPSSVPDDARIRYQQVDFDRIADHADFFSADIVLCCLGTTLRKAGSRAAFEKTDVTYPLIAAALALRQGARTFGVISAMGANKHSLFFYNRCKGLLEQGLCMLNFPSLVIVRPSLLIGNRNEKRPMESLMQRCTLPLLSILPAFWRPVFAESVAQILVKTTLSAPSGVRILYNRQLLSL